MDKPLCRLCNTKHWSNEDHVLPDLPVKPVNKPVKTVVTPVNKVVHGVVHMDNVVVHKSKHGQYADKEKRREYRRNWMKGKRANA